MFQNLEMQMQQANQSGKYQLKVFLVFSLIIMVIGIQLMSPTYTYIKPKLICNGIKCEENTQTCDDNNYEIADDFEYSNIITQFHLFCDKNKYISITSSMTFLGAIFGGSVMSYVADRYGRKQALTISWVIATIGFIGIYFSINIYMLIVTTFIMGFGQIGAYLLIPVVISEICNNKWRQIYSLSILVIWSISEIITAILHYYIYNWQTIQLWFVIVPAVCGLGLLTTIQETPKYYHSKGQYDKCLTQLNVIAAYNGRIPIMDSLSIQEYPQPKIQPKTYSFKHLFIYKSLRFPSIGFILISYSLHILYYGAQYGLKHISDGKMVYVMGVAVGMVECVTYILLAVLVQHLKRKSSLYFSYTSSILGCFAFMLVETYINSNQDYYAVVLACLIRIFNTIGFGLQGIYANEFYPTTLRALGSGFLFSVGVIGSFSAPYAIELSQVFNFNPFLLMGIISLIGPMGTALGNETYKQPLRDQVVEQDIINSQIKA